MASLLPIRPRVLHNGKFVNYTPLAGLPSPIIESITELDNGQILVGDNAGNLSLISNGKISSFRTQKPLPRQRVRVLFPDRRGNLWVGTYGGLLRISPDGRETWFNEKTGLPDFRIRVLFEDSESNFWGGTRDGGVFKQNKDGKMEILNTQSGFPPISFSLLDRTVPETC